MSSEVLLYGMQWSKEYEVETSLTAIAKRFLHSINHCTALHDFITVGITAHPLLLLPWHGNAPELVIAT